MITQKRSQPNARGRNQCRIRNEIFVRPPVQSRENDQSGVFSSIQDIPIRQCEQTDGIKSCTANSRKFGDRIGSFSYGKGAVGDRPQPMSLPSRAEKFSVGGDQGFRRKIGHVRSLDGRRPVLEMKSVRFKRWPALSPPAAKLVPAGKARVLRAIPDPFPRKDFSP